MLVGAILLIQHYAGWVPLRILGLHSFSQFGTLYVGLTGLFERRVHQHKYRSRFRKGLVFSRFDTSRNSLVHVGIVR